MTAAESDFESLFPHLPLINGKSTCYLFLGPTHDETAEAEGYLGVEHAACGNNEQGMVLLRHSVDVLYQCLGPDHVKTLKAMANLQKLE